MCLSVSSVPGICYGITTVIGLTQQLILHLWLAVRHDPAVSFNLFLLGGLLTKLAKRLTAGKVQICCLIYPCYILWLYDSKPSYLMTVLCWRFL